MLHTKSRGEEVLNITLFLSSFINCTKTYLYNYLYVGWSASARRAVFVRHHWQDRVDDTTIVSCVGQWTGWCRQMVDLLSGGRRCMEVRKIKKGPFSMYGTPYTQNDPFGFVIRLLGSVSCSEVGLPHVYPPYNGAKKRSFRMYRSIHTERPLNYCVLSFQIFLGRGLKGHEISRTLFKVRL